MEKIMSIGELKVAHADGAKIQFRMDGNRWVDVEDPVFDCPASHYRVKPQFRPFKDVAELTATWEKMMGMKVRPNTMPLIWVKGNGLALESKNVFITTFCDNTVTLSGFYGEQTMENMFDGFTFLDGTPFGVKEEA